MNTASETGVSLPFAGLCVSLDIGLLRTIRHFFVPLPLFKKK